MEPTSTGVLGVLFNAAKSLAGIVGQLRRAKREKRERVAGFFDAIASTLREVATRIEAGDPGQDTCVRLAVYANQLDEVLDGLGHVTRDETLDEMRSRFQRELDSATNHWLSHDPRTARSKRGLHLAVRYGERRIAVGRLARQAERAEEGLTSAMHADEGAKLHAELSDAIATDKIWDTAGEFQALADALRAR